jgi:ABC transporter with metal-binding/Fe-S-binding domain ATP-binding protein
MNCAILFSGGKDSMYAAYLTKKHGHNISCLISIVSENPESFMFHTPSISKVKKQAEVMKIPLIIQKTKGVKEKELKDLEKAIDIAKNKYDIKAVVTGAVESAYQASRVQKICDTLKLECFNPLWQKDQFELLNELLENKFEIVVTGVFAYPLNETWLGKKIDNKFIEDVKKLYDKYNINPSGEGGEFETFVKYCPLFSKKLEIIDKKICGKNNSWKMEIDVV